MTKEQVKYIYHPLGGLRLDMPSTLLKDHFATEAVNISLSESDLEVISGFSFLGNNLPLDSTILAVNQFIFLSDLVETVACTVGGVYRLNASNNWISILDPLDTWAADPDYPVTMTFSQNAILITNGIDEIKVWNGVDTYISSLPGGYIATDISTYGERLILANTIEIGKEYKQRIRWTKVGTYDDFTGGKAGFVDLFDTSGEILAMKKLGESLVIYKKDSIIMCNWIGGQSVFKFDTRVSDIGLVAPKAIANEGDRHLFLAYDNVYEFIGGRKVKPIGNGIQRKMPRLIREDDIHKSVAIRHGDEVWFFTPMQSGNPNIAFIYNWRRDAWSESTFKASSVGTYIDYERVLIGNLTGSIGNLEGMIGDFGGLSFKTKITLGDEDGNIFSKASQTFLYGEQPIQAYWCSKDFPGGEDYRNTYNRYRGVEFDAKGDKLSVWYSTDFGNNWVKIDTLTLTPTFDLYRAWFDTSARQIRFKFQNEEGSYFSLRTFKIMFREGATR